MTQWLELLYKFLIVGAIAIIIAFISFLFWTIIFYPKVKSHRLDSVINEQRRERDRILIQKANELKEYTDLLEKHTDLKVNYQELRKKIVDLETQLKTAQTELEAQVKDKETASKPKRKTTSKK